MSYSIHIGEAYISIEEDDCSLCVRVHHTTQEDAPFWPSPDDKHRGVDISEKSNGRFPGYSQMHEFAKETGTLDLWFDRDYGLLSQHPGCWKLTQSHLSTIQTALAWWKQRYPDAVPGWSEGQDAILARLVWYEWWFKWALENCELPAIENY